MKKFFEKNLEEIIFTTDREKLSERGLVINGKLLRQQRIGNYGIADLIEIERPVIHSYLGRIKGTITVYELKREKASVSAFFQAINYIRGIQRYIEKYHFGYASYFNYKIVLIGESVDPSSSLVFLPEILCDYVEDEIDDQNRFYFELYTYNYNVDGIQFKHCNYYKLNNEGF